MRLSADEGTTVYIDDGGGEPATRSIMDSMIEFARSATDGGFEITEKGGEHLLKAIDDFQHWLDVQSNRFIELQQARELGTSNGAKVVAPFLQEVVNDDQGFLAQLRTLRKSLDEASEGIKTAMENYRRTEEAAQSSFKNGGS